MSKSIATYVDGILIHIPKELLYTKTQGFYIPFLINKNAINFCKNPIPGELYYPTNANIVSRITEKMLDKNNLCFIKDNIYTNISNQNPDWIIITGFYFSENKMIFCHLEYENNEFSLINPKTRTIICENILPNNIYFVISDENTVVLSNIL